MQSQSPKEMKTPRGTARRLAREQQNYVTVEIGPVHHRIWARDHAHAMAKYRKSPLFYAGR